MRSASCRRGSTFGWITRLKTYQVDESVSESRRTGTAQRFSTRMSVRAQQRRAGSRNTAARPGFPPLRLHALVREHKDPGPKAAAYLWAAAAIFWSSAAPRPRSVAALSRVSGPGDARRSAFLGNL